MHNNIFSITVEEAAPEDLRRMELYQRNADWISQNWKRVGDECRGKVIAVSEGEIFVADDQPEAERLAKEKHPNDVPYATYIYKERVPRIYGNRVLPRKDDISAG